MGVAEVQEQMPAAQQAVSGVMTKLIIDYIRREYGSTMVGRLIDNLRDSAGRLYGEKILSDPNSWLPWEIKLQLFRRAVELTGDPATPRRIGEAFPEIQTANLLDVLARSITRPNRLASELIGLISKYNTVAKIEIIQQNSRSATFRYRVRPGNALNIHDCEFIKGLLIAMPRLFRMPPAQVSLTLHDGIPDAFCDYRIIWKVSNAPRYTYWGLILGGLFGAFIGGIASHWSDLPQVIGMLILIALFGLIIGGLLDRMSWSRQAIDLITKQGDELQRFTNDLQRRSRDLASLSEIARRLTSILNPEVLLSTILDELEQLIRFTTAELYLYNDTRFELVATRGLSEEIARTAAATAHSRYPGMVVDTRQPILSGDIPNDPRLAASAEHEVWSTGTTGIRSLLCVPIFYQNRCLGVIGLGSTEREAFDPGDLQLVTTFANQAAIAIENARLYAAIQNQLHRLEQFRQISLAISSSVELNTVLRMIADTASRLVDADSVQIQLADNISIHDTPTLQQSLAASILKSGSPVIIADMHQFELLNGIQSEPDMPRSFVALPMIANERTLGILYVNSNEPREFRAEEMNLLMLLSNQAAVALSNAQLYRGLSDEKHRIESLVNNMSEALFTVDNDLRITGWNPAAETLTGWTAVEVMGRRCADVLQTPRCAECPMRMLQQGGGSSSHFEYSIMTKSGRRIPTLAGYSTTRDSNNSLIGSVAVLNDITRLKEVERLKDNFVSMVSHEFRTPLTNIIAYADAVHSVPMEEEMVKEFTGVIYDEGKRLATLVEDVLTLARFDIGNWELKLTPTDLAEALTFCSNTFRQSLRRHDLYMLIEQPMPRLMVDRAKLIQILNNLISNAIKYSPKGGAVTVQCWLTPKEQIDETIPIAGRDTMTLLSQEFIQLDKDERDLMPAPGPTTHDLPPIVLKFMNDGTRQTPALPDITHWLIISVIDQGIGIPSSAMDQLFQRFSRIDNETTRTVKGTGLGLAIVKALIDAHNGQVWVTSEEGHGSTFTIGLPVSVAMHNQIELTEEEMVGGVTTSLTPLADAAPPVDE